ncbi:hypothetical protein BX600DRAFT_515497 [Xylariales sp. PMI_506]|nr:hypothetical protein BX600DRAFT_515497 [Xylariales sp. PMI_506]
MSPPILNPIPPPGLPVFPYLVAQHLTGLIIHKHTHGFLHDPTWTVSYGDLARDVSGSTLFTVEKKGRETYHIKHAQNGQLLSAVTRDVHVFHDDVYRGMRGGDGGEHVWEAKVKDHVFSSTEYEISLCPERPNATPLLMKGPVLGQEKGVLLNGVPVATFHTHHSGSNREDHVAVAAGFDMCVAVGLAFMRIDKQQREKKEDTMIVVESLVD